MLVDIHTHILPEVDDGASSYDEALEILKLQLEEGVTHVILTPHVQNRVQKVSSSELKSRLKNLRHMLESVCQK